MKARTLFKHKTNYLILLLILLVLVGCSGSKDKGPEAYAFTFRLAETHPADYPTTLADKEFARRVKEETDGRIDIIVYSNGELGEERSVIEQVQFGAIDFARVSIAPLSEIVEPLNVLQLPYLYSSSEHMWRVLNSEIGDYFKGTLEEEGFIGLAWYDGGARSFYNSVRPIETIEDLQGLNFRVMESTLMLDMVEVLGAQAVAMPYGQVFSGIQTGLIDGAENNYPSYETSEHYTVATYYTVDEHVRVPELLIASQKALENISDSDWELLNRIAQETESYQRDLWKKKEEESRIFLENQGVIFSVLKDRYNFMMKVEPIYERYKDLFRRLTTILKNIYAEIEGDNMSKHTTLNVEDFDLLESIVARIDQIKNLGRDEGGGNTITYFTYDSDEFSIWISEIEYLFNNNKFHPQRQSIISELKKFESNYNNHKISFEKISSILTRLYSSSQAPHLKDTQKNIVITQKTNIKPAMKTISQTSRKPNSVFVVHGRNNAIRTDFFTLLRAMNIEPIEWNQAKNLTGQPNAYIGDILDQVFDFAQGIVVLFTPDEEVKLKDEFITPDEETRELSYSGQSRPNVLFEAGLAYGSNRIRTLLIEIGNNRPFSDISGKHILRFDGSPETRHDLLEALKHIGLNPDVEGKRDWLTTGKFNI